MEKLCGESEHGSNFALHYYATKQKIFPDTSMSVRSPAPLYTSHTGLLLTAYLWLAPVSSHQAWLCRGNVLASDSVVASSMDLLPAQSFFQHGWSCWVAQPRPCPHHFPGQDKFCMLHALPHLAPCGHQRGQLSPCNVVPVCGCSTAVLLGALRLK